MAKRFYLENRKDFERKFYILSEMDRSGRLKFSISDRSSAQSLIRIESLPNGRFDLTTINESARAMSSMADSRFVDFNDEK